MSDEVPRRRVLGWLGLAGGAGAAAGALGDRVVADGQANAGQSRSWRVRRAGATTASEPGALPTSLRGPLPAFTHVLAVDLTESAARDHRSSRKAASDMLRRWSRLADTPPDKPGRHGAAGADIRTASLQVTPGIGASLLSKCGLDAQRPDALVDLPSFRTDRLREDLTGGDLVVQVAAEDPMRLAGAVQSIVSGLGDTGRLRWSRPGFRQTSVAVDHRNQTGRNLMGHKDGTNNPEHGSSLWETVVRARHPSGPARWMDGGSYLVVRQIRIDLADWFTEPENHRDRVIGRRTDTGAALGSESEHDSVRLAARDADGGLLVPAHAHIRLASSTRTDGSRIVRRTWNFDAGWLADGTRDAGLLFLAWQADPRRGFIPIQRSLVQGHDALNEYTTHVGSAVFAMPAQPAVDGYTGQQLLEA